MLFGIRDAHFNNISTPFSVIQSNGFDISSFEFIHITYVCLIHISKQHSHENVPLDIHTSMRFKCINSRYTLIFMVYHVNRKHFFIVRARLLLSLYHFVEVYVVFQAIRMVCFVPKHWAIYSLYCDVRFFSFIHSFQAFILYIIIESIKLTSFVFKQRRFFRTGQMWCMHGVCVHVCLCIS